MKDIFMAVPKIISKTRKSEKKSLVNSQKVSCAS